MQRRYTEVDVFSATPLRGNPVAVVLDAQGLSEERMQEFARWTNLSETTFVLPPSATAAAAGADYRVRIFTPGGELPFAGHPTLGTCFAWLQAGGTPRKAGMVLQECAKGLIPVRQDTAQLAFAAPPLQRHAPEPALVHEVLGALGLQHSAVLASQWLDNGPRWLGLLLDSATTVSTVQPDHATLKALGTKVGLAGRASAGAGTDADLEVRAFAAAIGITEDPVTGSLNASLAQWLMDTGHMPARYTAAQGMALGRDGRIHLQRDPEGQVWVGGQCHACVSGIVSV